MKQTMTGDVLTLGWQKYQYLLLQRKAHPVNIYTEELLLEQRVGHLFM